MRRPLIAGNWKMHGSESQVKALVEAIAQGAKQYSETDILVCPSFIHLSQVKNLLRNSSVLLGAQNLYIGDKGAFTGEVSANMLADLGCHYVLVGHSERRQIFKEDLTLVSAKFQAALAAGLMPILCVGETREEREQNQTIPVIQAQLDTVIQTAGIEVFKNAVIAYEPVWAIGTGLTATPEQAQAVHHFIREHLRQNNVDIANTMRILYGGSMKAENAASLLAMPDIDGGLIGGASLEAASFLQICEAAAQAKQSGETAVLVSGAK